MVGAGRRERNAGGDDHRSNEHSYSLFGQRRAGLYRRDPTSVATIRGRWGRIAT